MSNLNYTSSQLETNV